MTPTSLQAAIITAVSQIVALIVGFGILSSTTEGVVINAAAALVNVAFLIANGLHAQANATKAAAGK